VKPVDSRVDGAITNPSLDQARRCVPNVTHGIHEADGTAVSTIGAARLRMPSQPLQSSVRPDRLTHLALSLTPCLFHFRRPTDSSLS